MSAFSIAQIASWIDGSVEGDGAQIISGAAALEEATQNEVAFAASKTALQALDQSRAGCVIVPQKFSGSKERTLIRCQEPRAAFARILLRLYPAETPAAQIHATAILAPTARVNANCYIGAYVTVGEGSVIASGCSIGDGCVLGKGVTLGVGTRLLPRVTIYDGTEIGARCTIHSGAVIGADGFGFVLVDGTYQKFPQIGKVVIEDDVEIGAGCCIDRAALGKTHIGTGTKLDNLVHVAHNCTIGKHVVVAAQTGFSGSVTVGDYAIIGGQAGIGEKARIQPRAVIGGKAGILTSAVVHAGEPVWGIPARPLKQHLRGLAGISKLPELREETRRLRQRLDVLENSKERE